MDRSTACLGKRPRRIDGGLREVRPGLTYFDLDAESAGGDLTLCVTGCRRIEGNQRQHGRNNGLTAAVASPAM